MYPLSQSEFRHKILNPLDSRSKLNSPDTAPGKRKCPRRLFESVQEKGRFIIRSGLKRFGSLDFVFSKD